MNRPHAPGSPHSLAQALRRGLATRPFSEDTIQWGIVAAVHGSTNTMLTSAASAGDTTIYTAAAPLVNDLLVIGDTPTTTAPRVTAVTGSGPYTVSVQPELPATLTTGTSVTALPTIDVYLNGAQNPTPASSLTWGIGIAYGTTPPAVGSVIPLFRGIGGLKSDRFALSPGGDWIITGSGPPTAPPPNNQAGVLYLDITSGALYQYTVFDGVGAWAGVGGNINALPPDFSGPYVAVYPSGPFIAIEADGNDAIEVGVNNISLVSGGTLLFEGVDATTIIADNATWNFDTDGGLQWPAADNLTFETYASTIYSSQNSPISGAFGANGDWDFAENGNIYFNSSGNWTQFGGGTAGWQIATVSSVTYGSPTTIDLISSTSGVPCLVEYIPYVGDTALIALSTGYGTSGKVAIGAIVSTGGVTLPPGTHNLVVPPGVTSAQFALYGAQGSGTNGGYGAYLLATYPVTAGATIQVNCGTQGGSIAGGAQPGGAAADVRIGGTTLSDRVLVAAGGGGEGEVTGNAGGSGGPGTGGTGGGPVGGNTAGTGGTPSAGGTAGAGGNVVATNGILGEGGTPGSVFSTDYGGGGGDGLYGGGGGGPECGGGGGSDFIGPSATGVSENAGYQSGDGSAIVTWI
jgi:Glycine rich protein